MAIRLLGLRSPKGIKWIQLFEGFENQRPIEARVETQLYGDGLVAAIMLLSTTAPGTYNASGVVLDPAELLGEVARLTNW